MPEKSLNDIPRSVREQFDKGRSAVSANNLDYAINLFNGVLVKEPGFLACREALRQAQVKKAGAGTGSFLRKVIGTASSSPMLAKAQIQIRSNPLDAIATCEQILNSDPRNTRAHRTLADAALAAELPKTAVASLEFLRSLDSKDKGTGLALADAYVQVGDTFRAEAVLAELTTTYPDDPDLAKRHKNMAAKHTLNEKGYEQLASGKGSFRDVLKDKDEALTLEQAGKSKQSEDSTTRLIHELEGRMQQEPRNLKLARDIAELCVQIRHYDQALGYYQYILTQEGGADATIEKAVTDIALKRFDQSIEALDSAAPDYEAQKTQIAADRLAFFVADTERRAQKYPTDLHIRFELGVLYFEAGKLTEAIREFQRAQAHQNRRIAAMNYLGQCFARGGKLEMAARKLAEAIKEKPLFDDEKKDLVYNYGNVLSLLGRREEAVKQFELIYQDDIGYRDVQKRVDDFYASGGASA